MGNVINYYTIYINNIIAAEESLAEFLRARDSFSIIDHSLLSAGSSCRQNQIADTVPPEHR